MKRSANLFFPLLSGMLLLLSAGCGGGSSPNPATLDEEVNVQFQVDSSCTAPTNVPFSLTVNGSGALRLNRSGAVSFVSGGKFQLETNPHILMCGVYPVANGFIISESGSRLTGYNVDSNGVLETGTPTDVNIISASGGGLFPPAATKNISANVILDGRVTTLGAAGFNYANSGSFHFSTVSTFYDTLGNSHPIGVYYIKTNTNTWTIFAAVGAAISTPRPVDAPEPHVTQVGQLSFNAAGALTSPNPSTPFLLNIPLETGAVTPQQFAFSPTGTAQSNEASRTITVSQDGFPTGSITGFSITKDGKLFAKYSNGVTRLSAQLDLKGY